MVMFNSYVSLPEGIMNNHVFLHPVGTHERPPNSEDRNEDATGRPEVPKSAAVAVVGWFYAFWNGD